MPTRRGASTNRTAFSISREVPTGTTRGLDNGGDGRWRQLKIVGLSGFGASTTLRVDDSFDDSRQAKEGTIVDLNAGAAMASYFSVGTALELWPFFVMSKWVGGVGLTYNASLKTVQALTTPTALPKGAEIGMGYTDTAGTITLDSLVEARADDLALLVGYESGSGNNFRIVQYKVDSAGANGRWVPHSEAGNYDRGGDLANADGESAANSASMFVNIGFSAPLKSSGAFVPKPAASASNQTPTNYPRTSGAQASIVINNTADQKLAERLHPGQFVYNKWLGWFRVVVIRAAATGSNMVIEIDKLRANFFSATNTPPATVTSGFTGSQEFFTGVFLRNVNESDPDFNSQEAIMEVIYDSLEDIDSPYNEDGSLKSLEDVNVNFPQITQAKLTAATALAKGVDQSIELTVANANTGNTGSRTNKWTLDSAGKRKLNESARHYLRGAIGDSMVLSLAATDLINAQYQWNGSDVEPKLVDGVVLDKDAFNTRGARPAAPLAKVMDATNSIVRRRLSVAPNALSPQNVGADLISVVEALSITLTNNTSPQKNTGVLGNEWINIGDIQIGVDFQGVLDKARYSELVRNAKPATMEVIFANQQGGVAIDVPRLNISTGGMSFQQHQPVRLGLSGQAFRDEEQGFFTVLGITVFPFLPETSRRNERHL